MDVVVPKGQICSNDCLTCSSRLVLKNGEPHLYWREHRNWAVNQLKGSLELYKTLSERTAVGDDTKVCMRPKLMSFAAMIDNSLSGIQWLLGTIHLSFIMEPKELSQDELKILHKTIVYIEKCYHINGFSGYPGSCHCTLRNTFAGVVSLFYLYRIIEYSEDVEAKDKVKYLLNQLIIMNESNSDEGPLTSTIHNFLTCCFRRDGRGFNNEPSIRSTIGNDLEDLSESPDVSTTLCGLGLIDYVERWTKRKPRRKALSNVIGLNENKLSDYLHESLKKDHLRSGTGFGEIHAAYTYCTLACISILKRYHIDCVSKEQLYPIKAEIVPWINSSLSCKIGDKVIGYTSRSNRYTPDLCYNWWNGASLKLLDSLCPSGTTGRSDNEELESRYIVTDDNRIINGPGLWLYWSQYEEGGISRGRSVRKNLCNINNQQLSHKSPTALVDNGTNNDQSKSNKKVNMMINSIFSSSIEPFELFQEPIHSLSSCSLQNFLPSLQSLSSTDLPTHCQRCETSYDTDYPSDAFHTYYGLMSSFMHLRTEEADNVIIWDICTLKELFI